MRAAAVVALLVLPLAGCLSGEDLAADSQPQSPSVPAPPPLHPEGTREFCDDEASCDYWDDDYHEFVVYDLDTTVLDVVILPPAGPLVEGLAVSRLAVQQWEDGIRAFAAPWFNGSFEVNVYAVGIDVPSLDAVQDPEIVVASTAAEFLIGIGLEPKQIGCILVDGGEAVREYPVHRHPGGEVRAMDCTGTGFTCFALNVGGLGPYGLYDLIAHEVGHCLGAGHVGDALDFRSRYAPVEDIMSYQNNATQVHCVSSLNVRVLEGVYAHLLDQPEEVRLPRGSFYAMSPLDYRQAPCANP